MADTIPPVAAASIDFILLAKSLSSSDFVKACPWVFFVGRDELEKPVGPSRTIVPGAMLAPGFEDEGSTATYRIEEVVAPHMQVLALRKVQPMFPSMITIGRTANNDIVVADISVSKFHAYVRTAGDTIELTDAGARNGTFVGTQQLEPNGAAVRIAPGMHVRFGRRNFDVLTAADTWTRIHKK